MCQNDGDGKSISVPSCCCLPMFVGHAHSHRPKVTSIHQPQMSRAQQVSISMKSVSKVFRKHATFNKYLRVLATCKSKFFAIIYCSLLFVIYGVNKLDDVESKRSACDKLEQQNRTKQCHANYLHQIEYGRERMQHWKIIIRCALCTVYQFTYFSHIVVGVR